MAPERLIRRLKLSHRTPISLPGGLPVTQAEQTPDDAARELTQVQAALGKMVALLMEAHDDRVVAVGKKFFEVGASAPD